MIKSGYYIVELSSGFSKIIKRWSQAESFTIFEKLLDCFNLRDFGVFSMPFDSVTIHGADLTCESANFVVG